MTSSHNQPLNVEVTSKGGASKWIKNVVSHTEEEIRAAHINKERITLVDTDDTSMDVDLSEAFTVRYQDSESYEKRVQEAKEDATDPRGKRAHGKRG